MAVTSSAKKFRSRVSVDERGVTTVVDVYDIIFGADTDTEQDGLSATSPFPIPQQGDAHADYTSTTLRRIEAERDNPLNMTATLTYSDDLGTVGAFPTNPLAWPIQWSLAFESREEALEKEPGSDPVVEVQNTAGDWFDPQPTFPRYMAVLSLQKNISSLSLTTVRNVQGKTNSNLFLAQPVNQVLCRSIRAVGPQYFQSTSYAQVTYEFLMDADAHVVKLLSQGYNFINGNGNKDEIKTDVSGRPITRPQNLDVDGAVTDGDAYEQTFKRFESTNFSVFGITLSDLTGLSG